MSYTLRPYQQEAVDLAIKYMRKNSRECKKINGQWDDDWSSDYANYARKTGEAMSDIFGRRIYRKSIEWQKTILSTI